MDCGTFPSKNKRSQQIVASLHPHTQDYTLKDKKKNIFRNRYFRQHCNLDYGSYTKDLKTICPDLSSIFILDNSPGAYKDYPHNAIPIKSWFSDPNDTALLNLLPILDGLRFVSDVRSVLSRNRAAYRMNSTR